MFVKSKCSGCRHSMVNGAKACKLRCGFGNGFELFESIHAVKAPVWGGLGEEKVYTLLELVEGEEYSCDEYPASVYIVKDLDMYCKCSKSIQWKNVSKIFEKRTFRKIEQNKKLTFADLKAGEVYIGETSEFVFIALHRNKAVFAYRDSFEDFPEESISGWKVKAKDKVDGGLEVSSKTVLDQLERINKLEQKLEDY